MSWVWIGLASQTLKVYAGDYSPSPQAKDCIFQASVSTGMAGNGEQVNSGKTPRGRHVVAKKIGEGLPDNAVLVGREWTGELYSSALGQQSPERDWILNRILWLAGEEAGFNHGEGCDSFSRYIYIHGTPETEPMGRPLSKGCVRLHRDALLKVFDLIKEGDVVYLEEQA